MKNSELWIITLLNAIPFANTVSRPPCLIDIVYLDKINTSITCWFSRKSLFLSYKHSKKDFESKQVSWHSFFAYYSWFFVAFAQYLERCAFLSGKKVIICQKILIDFSCFFINLSLRGIKKCCSRMKYERRDQLMLISVSDN